MARYTGADCKLCRREKVKLFLKGSKCDSPKCPIEIRPYPPGEHGRNRQKDSEYLIQIREKQKARRIYGVLEKQFAGYYEEAARKSGRTGETLLQILESRLDNVVYRAGFAKSRDMARQLVRHGHIKVNGRRVDIPSYRVKESDVVEVTEKSLEAHPDDRGARRGRRASGPGLARRHLRPDEDPRAPAAGPGADRHPGPGTADRRVLLQVSLNGGRNGSVRLRSVASNSGRRGKEVRC